ncbi:MAG: ABC transporter permease [Candidatus Buchananbacteria bacterium]
MKIADVLEETYSALSANKVRSGLTILGIVIGISSVIAMLSIGFGAQSSIESSIQSIGSNLIMVMPGAQRGPGVTVSAGRGSAKTLTMEDADAIKELDLVKAVAPEVSGRYQIAAKGQNTNTQVIGTVSAYSSVKNIEVESGNFLSDQNIASASKVAVIGPTVRDDVFGTDADAIGQTIRIDKTDFKVIGMTKAKGGSGFNNTDNMVYVPITTAQRLLTGNKYVTTINVEAQDANSMTSVQESITSLLLTRHNISDATNADFSTLNQADIIATASSITGILTALLGSVAGISLIVGGIGIMNMMLTTVTERTKEIGLRKAIGAKAKDISIQFLIEAIALTVIGGLVGIVLGWAIAFGITYFGVMQTKVSWYSILLSFGVSAIIGIVFGYYPARRAAKLNPIQALRFE